MFVLLGFGGQAESPACKDKAYEESERSPNPIEVSSKTLVTADTGFHPMVCISVKVLINFAITFAFLGHEFVETCRRASLLLYQDERQQTSSVFLGFQWQRMSCMALS